MSIFFVLEGLDGSGKTTQATNLKKLFTDKNIAFLASREPTDDVLGAIARQAVADGSSMSAQDLAFIFAADRVQHFSKTIMPALEAGIHVMCDRYYYSSVAYQGTSDAELRRVLELNRVVMNARPPDAVFFLDTPPQVCAERIETTRTRTGIYETLPDLQKQRENYMAMFDTLFAHENIIIIETANKTIGNITDEIVGHLSVLKFFE